MDFRGSLFFEYVDYRKYRNVTFILRCDMEEKKLLASKDNDKYLNSENKTFN